MNLKMSKSMKNMVTVTVEVGKDEFAPANVEKAYKKQVKQMKIPGFVLATARPRKVIEECMAEIF